MKHANEHEPNRRTDAPRKLSIVDRTGARITGVSMDALARATDDDLKAMRLYALSFVLVIANALLVFGVMLHIILGSFVEYWYIALGVGLVIFVFDRAIARNHLVNAGRKEAARRGFRTVEAANGRSQFGHTLMRVFASVCVSLTAATILLLMVFQQDIHAYIGKDNQKENAETIAEAYVRVDHEIAGKEAEIERLKAEMQAARNATSSQIAALTAEREALQETVNDLQKDLACEEQNLLAEKTGQTRCDKVATVPGMGYRYAFAQGRVESLRAQLAQPRNRLNQIETELARVRHEAPDGLPAQARQLQDQIAEQQDMLARLRADRDSKALASIHDDARHIPMPDGLLTWGDALEAMRNGSAWMNRIVWLFSLMLLATEMVVFFTVLVMPPPITIVFEEVANAERVMTDAQGWHEQEISRHEQTIAKARQATLKERTRMAKSEIEFEAALRNLRRRQIIDELLGEEDLLGGTDRDNPHSHDDDEEQYRRT